MRLLGIGLGATATLALALATLGHADTASAASNGASIYTTNCASCHQANGQGVPGAFPPLAKNAVVTGDPKKVETILVHGLNGKIKVNGKDYNGQMPAWRPTLSNADIAAVITYVRSSWGNKASAVTESQVASVK